MIKELPEVTLAWESAAHVRTRHHGDFIRLEVNVQTALVRSVRPTVLFAREPSNDYC